MLPIRCGYLIGDFFFLAVWILLFWKRKDVRREMLAMSIAGGIIGPFSEYWYFKDYWNPPMILRPSWPFGGLEDVLFGFAIGGIAAAAYEVLLRERLVCPTAPKRRQNWVLLVFPAAVVISLLILTDIFGLNSIYTSSVAFLILFALMVKLRPDLFRDAIFSGLLVMLVMFAIYFFYLPSFIGRYGRELWQLYGTSGGVLILGRVPLTEMLWGMTWGMVGGPLYEFWRGCKLRSA